MAIREPDRRVLHEFKCMEVDSLVWILVTEMAVRDVPLPLGRFVIPVIPQSDDEEEQEFAQLEEDDEEEQDFVTSRKRQGREVAAMQRRFQVLRSSALNADQGDIGYPMTIPLRKRPPQRWLDIGVGSLGAAPGVMIGRQVLD